VRGHVEAGRRPSVWIDDNLHLMAPRLEPVLANHRHLLIAPHRSVGLPRRHLDAVEGFLAQEA